MDLQHPNPALKDQADYVIGARIEDDIWSKQYDFEQLAAKKIDDSTFMICCIPFALYDITIGDLVEVDDELNVIKVVKVSDHVAFRIATKSATQQASLLELLSSMSANYEVFSDNLIAVDVDNNIDGSNLADKLAELEDSKQIVEYETIRTK